MLPCVAVSVTLFVIVVKFELLQPLMLILFLVSFFCLFISIWAKTKYFKPPKIGYCNAAKNDCLIGKQSLKLLFLQPTLKKACMI